MQTPTPPFQVRGIADFNVAPIVVGQKYTITDISQDGTQWQTMAPNGKLGWFPAQMCKPVTTQKPAARTASPQQQQPQRVTSTNQRAVSPRAAATQKQGQGQGQSQNNPMESTLFGDVVLDEWEQQ